VYINMSIQKALKEYFELMSHGKFWIFI
jgi:hypothetical protein